MTLVVGDVCAACVPWSKSEKPSWLVTRIESISPDGSYRVRDEYPESDDAEIWDVQTTEIATFPAKPSQIQSGSKVLALWYDEDSNEWSTMFYEATVLEATGTNILIEFVGSSLPVQTDVSKLALLPEEIEIDQMAPEEPPIEQTATSVEEPEVQKKLIFSLAPVATSDSHFEPISDEELSKLLPPVTPPRRVQSIEGTPLIDMLNDSDLFPADGFHITVNGSLVVTNIADNEDVECGLMNPNIKVGRLTQILHEWRNS
jgi:hypothetical protein